MIDTLKFVKAAVCKAGHNPAMMHFRIKNRTIQANNGRLAIQAPLQVDLDCCPHAETFIKAIAACEDVITLHVESGRLVVRSGKFKTNVPICDKDRFPEYTPTGARFPVPAAIVPTLKNLLPFVATNERQPWACGVLFTKQSALATNSICMVENWLPVAFPVDCIIPRDAITELVRLKVEPISLQISAHAVIFHFPGDAWVACSAMAHQWPDTSRVFDNAARFTGPFMQSQPLKTLLADVAKLEPFTGDDEAIYFHPGIISTHPAGVPGTTVDCPQSPGVGVFRADQLQALQGQIDRIGWGAYPAPVPFFGGETLRGVIVGYNGR